jgi:hypothetical protein
VNVESNKPDNCHHLVPYAPQSHIIAICLKNIIDLIWRVEHKDNVDKRNNSLIIRSCRYELILHLHTIGVIYFSTSQNLIS